MLHLDAGSGKLQVRLPVRLSLTAIIPACQGYANLSGNTNERVHELVKEWRSRGWIEYASGSVLSGDYVVVDQTIPAYKLARMDTEWCTLQYQLAEALEHG